MAAKRGRPRKIDIPKSANVYNINLEKQIEGSPITKNSSMGWVKWGQNNSYPNLLLNLYNMSPTHRSAINFGVQSIVGNGVDYDAMNIDGSQVIPNYSQSWDDVIKSLALDYMLYGSYALQIIRNKDGNTFSYWHIPLDKVRWSEFDEDGQITSYWISNDWTATGQNPPFEIEAFDMRDDNIIENGKPYLYVYREYSPSMTYYTQPHYQAAIQAIQSEIEYVNYDLSTTVNNFVPAGMLILNEVETDEEKRAIIKNVTNMFTGSENANSLMIQFRSNIEEKSPEFIPFVTNQGNVNIYDSANQRTINRILCAHQIPSASLIGLPDIGNTGFASDSQKLETAYQIYNKLTGNSNRMAVIKTLNAMLRMNGVETEVVMKPLSFNDFENDANVKERTTTNAISINPDNNNEEKVE